MSDTPRLLPFHVQWTKRVEAVVWAFDHDDARKAAQAEVELIDTYWLDEPWTIDYVAQIAGARVPSPDDVVCVDGELLRVDEAPLHVKALLAEAEEEECP